MRLVTRGSLLALLLLGSLPVWSAGASMKRRSAPTCRAGHAHTIASDNRAQVYLAPEAGVGPLEVFGCAYGRRRVVKLGLAPFGSSSGAGGIEHVTLSGAIVAYEEFEGGGVGGTLEAYRVLVRDLRSGRVLHKLATGSPAKPAPGHIGVGPVESIVVKGNGAVAWIADDYERSAGSYEVHYFDVMAADSSGVRLLAAGPDIDPASLALASGAEHVGVNARTIPGSTIYWTQGGTPHAAPLN